MGNSLIRRFSRYDCLGGTGECRKLSCLKHFCNATTTPRGQMPLGSIKTTIEREKKLFHKVSQRSSSLMRPSPSCPLEKPLSSSVECVGEVLAYIAERERLVSSPYLRASSVDGGNELLDWGMWRSVPGRQVLQQLWRITHSGKLWVALHVHRAGKSPRKRLSMPAQIKDRYSEPCRKGHGISLWESCITASQF